jgi:hypothetical protein
MDYKIRWLNNHMKRIWDLCFMVLRDASRDQSKVNDSGFNQVKTIYLLMQLIK